MTTADVTALLGTLAAFLTALSELIRTLRRSPKAREGRLTEISGSGPNNESS